MGNSTSVKLKKQDDVFDNSYLDVYLYGNYNPIMEIIIGDKKKDYDFVNIKGYKLNENKDYISVEQNPMDEKTNLNETLINNKNNNIFNNDSEEKNNIIDIDKFLKGFKSHKKEIMSKKPYKVKNSLFNWKLNFYCEETFNSNKLINLRDKFLNNFYEEQKNVLILFIDSKNIIFEVINIFSKINSDNHPLFLLVINREKMHLTKQQILLEMDDYLKAEKIKYFNLRNVTLLEKVDLFETPKEIVEFHNFNKKKCDYIFGLYSFLINSWFYYNNLGDDFEFGKYLENYSNKFLEDINNENLNINLNSHVGLFNIMVLGKPGTGKSTLINVLSNKKRSLEGRGESVTKRIIKYIIKDYNISLYDTPGFELDKDINMIIKEIKKLQKQLFQGKHQINLVFYLITGCARDFYENEKKILKTLIEYNIPTFFLLTFSNDLKKSKEFKEIVEINLRRTLKQIDKVKGMNYYYNQVKVFPVHLLDENDDSCSNFGLKTVMEAAFEKFKNCIIEENELDLLDNIMNDYQKENSDEKPNRIKEIFNLLEGKEIYKYFKDIDDVLNSSIDQSKSVISKYTIYAFALSILNLAIIPSFIYMNKLKKNLISEIANIFKMVLDDTEIEELIKINLKENENIAIKSNFPILNLYYNRQNIKNFGNYLVETFINKLKTASIDGLSIFIKKFIQCNNNAINGLKEIGQKFND